MKALSGRAGWAWAFGVALLGLIMASCAPGGVPSPFARELKWPFGLPEVGQAAGSSEDAERASIQIVIYRGNFEQEQAIARKDPSPMRESSTDSHYRDLTRTNELLIDSGVRRVRLDALEWGSVAINGTTAEATTFETWTAEAVDGTTQQSRDRNVYTLVKRDGVWKIQADDHPDSGGANPPADQTPADATPSAGNRRNQGPLILPRGTQTQA